MRLTLALVLAVAAVACSATPPGSDAPGRGDTPIVARARALDGDTVSIDIRLLGADAFESRQSCRNAMGCWQCGRAAQDFAARLLRSGPATIRLTGSASYGRAVGTVAVDGRDLGEAMIAAGHAVPMPQYLKGDAERAKTYAAAWDRAVAARAGAHAGVFIEPARWRRGERLSCERRVRHAG